MGDGEVVDEDLDLTDSATEARKAAEKIEGHIEIEASSCLRRFNNGNTHWRPN